MQNMNIELPDSVALILRELNKHGHEAYAVGGCVRDAVMGRIPHDWDITTSAKPEEVKSIFHKTIDTGIQHGTVTVMINKVGYEVTTFRVDGKYGDGRHPDKVNFTANLTEDLKRRDFTINAMAYSPKTGIVDEFGGIEDLKNKIIRCVGNPCERFDEDALRILRAVRFSAQLDFEIEQNTYEAIKILKENLIKISRERIQTELEKLLMSDHPEKINTIFETQIHKIIFPGTNISQGYRKVNKVRKEHYLRWAALLCETGTESAALLKGLKFDNKTIDVVSRLVINGKSIPQTDERKVRVHICKVGADIYELYLEYVKNVMLYNTEDIEKIYKDIIQNKHCLSIKDMEIKGTDLKEIGINPGKEMGIILNSLFEKVLDNPELNNRDTLLAMAEEQKNNV